MPGSPSHPHQPHQPHQPNAASHPPHPPHLPQSQRPQKPPKAPLPAWQRRVAVIGAAVTTAVVLAFCVGVVVAVNNDVPTGGAAATPTAIPTTASHATPTPPRVQLFTSSGTGDAVLAPFAATATWYLQWSCTPTPPNTSGKLDISIWNGKGAGDGGHGPAGGVCPTSGASGGEPQEYSPYVGLYHLEIASTGVSWKITVTQ